MRMGVRYYIKHSGEFLYKVSNEDDQLNFKVTKIRIPSNLKYLPESVERNLITDKVGEMAKRDSKD